jgi:DNA repair/transcription protein MET18/MMS19
MIHWAIHLAPSPFQQHYALELITSFVNKRHSSEGMEDILAGTLDRIWTGDVQDLKKAEMVRRRALAVFLHVSGYADSILIF